MSTLTAIPTNRAPSSVTPSGATGPRAAVLLVVGTDTDLTVVPTTPPLTERPVVLDADNLRDAARVAAGLGPGDDGVAPLPLLRIDISGVTRPDAIVFRTDPRLLAGLIGDAVRAGVARGAVIVGVGGPADRAALRAAVTAHLHADTFDVRTTVPGVTIDGGDLHMS